MVNTDEKIKCQFCNRIILRFEAVKYTDGSFACDNCSDDLQEYSADIAGELLDEEGYES